MEQYKGDASPIKVSIIEGGKEVILASHDTGGQDGSIPFGWFSLRNAIMGEPIMDDKFIIGNASGDHGDIETNLIDDWAKENYIAPWDAEEIVKCDRSYCGRIWPKEKIFAFFASTTGYPDRKRMDFILKELEAKLALYFDDTYTVYINDEEDPRSKTKDTHLINAYPLMEFLTGVVKTPYSDDKKKQQSNFALGKLSGEKKYQDALANDPRMDKMYRNFVAEGKKIIMTESQARFLIRKIKKG